jgi:hypothetical protein
MKQLVCQIAIDVLEPKNNKLFIALLENRVNPQPARGRRPSHPAAGGQKYFLAILFSD